MRQTRIWYCPLHNKWFARPWYYDRTNPDSERYHGLGGGTKCGPLVPYLAIPEDPNTSSVPLSMLRVTSDVISSQSGFPRGEYMVLGSAEVFSMAYRRDPLSRFGPHIYRDESLFDPSVSILTPPKESS